MAFLPSAQVTGVISDRRTIGSGEPHRIAILSPPACLHIDLQSAVGKQICPCIALIAGDAPGLRCCCHSSWHKTSPCHSLQLLTARGWELSWNCANVAPKHLCTCMTHQQTLQTTGSDSKHFTGRIMVCKCFCQEGAKCKWKHLHPYLHFKFNRRHNL